MRFLEELLSGSGFGSVLIIGAWVSILYGAVDVAVSGANPLIVACVLWVITVWIGNLGFQLGYGLRDRHAWEERERERVEREREEREREARANDPSNDNP